MDLAIQATILCGGSGTRLWPLSRKQFPKQFVPLFEGKSLLTLTCERLKVLLSKFPKDSVSVQLITGNEHRFLAKEAARAAGVQPTLLLEPEGRNTAAAMAAIALRQAEPAKALLLFVPADNYIPDYEGFAKAVRQGLKCAQNGHWVIAGVRPSFPATGYGYIRARDLEQSDSAEVLRFVEKPDREKALEMLSQGDYFWNAGIFLVRADVLIQSLKALQPELLSAVEQAVRDGSQPRKEPDEFLLADSFRNVQSISIDYAVLEHQKNIRMVKIEGVWSDVGSWNSVAQLTSEADQEGNRVKGQGFASRGTKNCYIHAPHRPVVAVGVEQLLIVDTADAVLVAHQDAAEHVKDAVQMLEAQGQPQASAHRRVARPWGSYDSIDEGERFLVKRITVNPGAALSLQMHHHRAEHWIVVRGTAQVTRGDEVFLLSENQSTFIPLGVKHRLENPGLVPLEMIEVQSGTFLSEDDIVRFSDQYGRAP